MMLEPSWALWCLIVPKTSMTVKLWRLTQWPYWVEDIHVTNASSEQDILHLPTCPKWRSVGEYGLLEIQREPVHHLGWVSAVWVIWCSSSSSTYVPAQPKHQHLATVRNPNPRRLSFQTLRYVQRSNNPPSVWAPPLLSGFDRVGHSCLLGTVAKLFTAQISQGRAEKVAKEWNTSDLTWPLFDHFHRASCVEERGQADANWTESLNQEKTCSFLSPTCKFG